MVTYSNDGNLTNTSKKLFSLKKQMILPDPLSALRQKSTKKKPMKNIIGFLVKKVASCYSPIKHVYSTIAVGRLNFCVRNGNRCNTTAMDTNKIKIANCEIIKTIVLIKKNLIVGKTSIFYIERVFFSYRILTTY